MSFSMLLTVTRGQLCCIKGKVRYNKNPYKIGIATVFNIIVSGR